MHKKMNYTPSDFDSEIWTMICSDIFRGNKIRIISQWWTSNQRFNNFVQNSFVMESFQFGKRLHSWHLCQDVVPVVLCMKCHGYRNCVSPQSSVVQFPQLTMILGLGTSTIIGMSCKRSYKIVSHWFNSLKRTAIGSSFDGTKKHSKNDRAM